MAGTTLQATNDVNQIEAPVTWKAYLICAFASFGGIFFGYDSGYINGVLGSSIFYKLVDGANATSLSTSHTSLVTSILSAGTFVGALIAGDVSDRIGRKWSVITGCFIYLIGVIIQMVTGPEVDALGTIVAGRLIAGLGVGFESAIVILYMSEIVSFSANVSNKFILILSSAQRESVVPSLLVTSSASPSAFSLPLASSTLPRTATTPVLTESQLPSNSLGVLSSVVVSSSSQTPHVISSSAESSPRLPAPFPAFEDSQSTPSTFRSSLLRLLPTRSTSAPSSQLLVSSVHG